VSRITSLIGLPDRHISKLLLVISVLAASVLAGCEARLDLVGIETSLNEPIRRTDQLMSIQQFSDGSQIIFGDNGLVLTKPESTDTWSRQQLGSDLLKPNFVDASVCADDSVVVLSYQNQVWSSADKGNSWQSYDLPTQEEVQAIDCTPAGDIWVVGSFSTLLVSRDKGQSWVETSMDEDSMLTQISFISATEGFVVGEFGLLLVTENAGESWDILDPIGEDFYPLAAYFKDRNTGWVGGLRGVIMSTGDGGLSWQRQQVDSDVPIYNFTANGFLYATGDQGTVLRLEGDHWKKQPTPDIPTYYRSSIVTGKDSLLVVGGWGVLLPLDLSARIND